MLGLVEEPLVGVQPHVNEWVVNMQDADATLLQFHTEEGILITIFATVFIEKNAKERGTAHHDVEGGELVIGVQIPFCRTAMEVSVFLIFEA